MCLTMLVLLIPLGLYYLLFVHPEIKGLRIFDPLHGREYDL